MRKSILILLLLWVLPKAWGQDITAVEYFFDSDLGFGKSTRVNVTPSADPSFTFNPDTRGLTPGFHFLYIRTLDSRGEWSQTTRRMIEVPVPGQPGVVQAVEYFNTTDPGFGASSRVNVPALAPDVEYSFFIPRSQLRTGRDTFYFRAVDSLGRFWSQTQRDTATVVFVDCDPPAQPPLVRSDSICSGGEFFYSVTAVAGAQGFFWNVPAGWTVVSGQGDDTVLLKAPLVTAPTSYTLSVAAYNACDTGQSREFDMLVNPLPSSPSVTAGGPLTFCDGGSVTLTSSAAATYQWIRDGVTINGANLSTYQATTSGSYTVRVSNASGCRNLSPAVAVIVNPGPAKPIISWNGTELSTPAGFAGYRWTVDGVGIASATTNTLRPTQTGQYTVAITGASGCVTFSDQFNLVVTGISDVRLGSSVVRCFPNPASDVIQLQATNVVPGKIQVQLFDMNGKRMIDTRLVSDVSRLSTAHLPQGIYHLLISNETERRSFKVLIVH